MEASNGQNAPYQAHLAPFADALTPENCVFLMIDHQVGLLQFLPAIEPGLLTDGILGLAKTAKAFDIPIILTTSWPNGPNGPTMPELAALFPGQEIIDRSFDLSLTSGGLLIFSPEYLLENSRTTWDAPVCIMNFFLEPKAVAAACRTTDLDYAAIEFIDRFPARDAFLEQVVRQLSRELEAGGPGGRFYAETMMQALAVHLLTHHTAEVPTLRERGGGLPGFRLRRVEEYVAAHLAEEITLDDLAGAAGGMNAYHFSRLFKKSTGTPPYQYVIQRRAERAKRLLVQTELPIFQVALEVGYGSQSHFTRLFKKYVGATPGTYRRERKR